jgi:hypothetical protein
VSSTELDLPTSHHSLIQKMSSSYKVDVEKAVGHESEPDKVGSFQGISSV